MDKILMTLTCLSAALVLYHHVGYPLLLGWLARRRRTIPIPDPQRGYAPRSIDSALPTVTVVIPAYNEAEHVADKIRNLAALDYPESNLRVVLACDGCTDLTAQIANEVSAEPEIESLNLDITVYERNRGKVSVINTVMDSVDSDLVALSDVSALVSVDALLVAARRFEDREVGVVCGAYRLLNPGGDGEASYWRYQSAIKAGESALGSTLGVHGAFYIFRRALFSPLDNNTINDDFVLPMSIVSLGYRAIYEPKVMALELESADLALDRRRRLRIAAGNTQQLFKFLRILRPSFGGVAFTFSSGKALRVLMPFCLLWLFVGSALLAPAHPYFAIAFGLQVCGYAAVAATHLYGPERAPAVMTKIHYLVQGHLSGLIGTLRYLCGRHRGGWRRATLNTGDHQ